ncbi:OsmC family protein [Aquisphaera giovannonii]|nr:OsmC family protein [Aquisphaera giovannonii]
MPNNTRRVAACGLAVAAWWLLSSPDLRAQATHTSHDWAQSPAGSGEGDSVRDFQARLRSALSLLEGRPELDRPLPLAASVAAEGRTGIRHLRIRDFDILSDGARETAEFELGAGSWPSVVGVLGSAVAGDFLTRAAIKGSPIDGLEVVFTSRPEAARSRGTGDRVVYPQALAYTAFIDSPASDEELEGLRAEVERLSPVLNLVARPHDIEHGRLVYTQTPTRREGRTLAGLREFLEDKDAASRGARPPEGRRAEPPRARDDGRPPLRAHVKVEGATGIRHIRTDLKNYQVIHDYPRHLAGHNLGPVPEEHILGTMITCLTHIYEIEAARRRVAMDTLELDVEGTLTTRLGNAASPPSYRDIRYTVRIGSPEPRAKIEELQRAVEAVCPIYNMLKNSQPIAGRIVRGPYSVEKEREVAR